MSCQRLWVIRFASSPTQNTGNEMPISADDHEQRVHERAAKTAAAIPIAIEHDHPDHRRPQHQRQRYRARPSICGSTWLPRLTYDTRSRVMKRCFIISAYRTGSGRSSPNWWLIWRDGGRRGVAPGDPGCRVDARGREEDEEDEHADREHHEHDGCDQCAWMMNAPTHISYALTRSLAARIERVAHAVAEDVQRHQHLVSTIMMPGAIASPRAGVEQRAGRRR